MTRWPIRREPLYVYGTIGMSPMRGLGVGGAELNREIVSCRACVRAVCMSSEIGAKNVVCRFPLSLFGPGGFPFSLSPPPNLLSSFSWLYRYRIPYIIRKYGIYRILGIRIPYTVYGIPVYRIPVYGTVCYTVTGYTVKPHEWAGGWERRGMSPVFPTQRRMVHGS